MARDDLASMPLDELWELYEEICAILSARIVEEKKTLEHRLELLQGAAVVQPRAMAQDDFPKRRKYPAVQPKYRNPDRPAETWAGRGKQPKWVVNALAQGKDLEDFLIEEPAVTD